MALFFSIEYIQYSVYCIYGIYLCTMLQCSQLLKLMSLSQQLTIKILLCEKVDNKTEQKPHTVFNVH